MSADQSVSIDERVAEAARMALRNLDDERYEALRDELRNALEARDTRSLTQTPLPFLPTFVTVFWSIAEGGYSRLWNDDPLRYGVDEDDKDEFRADLANCISETFVALNVPEPDDVEDLGAVYDALVSTLPNLQAWIEEEEAVDG